LIAHSMGNVVASEALRLATTQNFAPIPNVQPIINSYIAMQAAIPAEAYDAQVPKTLFTSAPFGFIANVQKTTPDVYQNYPGRAGYIPGVEVPLFYSIGAAASSLWNFYNPLDYALLGWQLNELSKPYGPYQFSGSFNADGDITQGTFEGHQGIS